MIASATYWDPAKNLKHSNEDERAMNRPIDGIQMQYNTTNAGYNNLQYTVIPNQTYGRHQSMPGSFNSSDSVNHLTSSANTYNNFNMSPYYSLVPRVAGPHDVLRQPIVGSGYSVANSNNSIYAGVSSQAQLMPQAHVVSEPKANCRSNSLVPNVAQTHGIDGASETSNSRVMYGSIDFLQPRPEPMASEHTLPLYHRQVTPIANQAKLEFSEANNETEDMPNVCKLAIIQKNKHQGQNKQNENIPRKSKPLKRKSASKSEDYRKIATERENQRMLQLRIQFEELRKMLPTCEHPDTNKPLCKMLILQLGIQYVEKLKQMLPCDSDICMPDFEVESCLQVRKNLHDWNAADMVEKHIGQESYETSNAVPLAFQSQPHNLMSLQAPPVPDDSESIYLYQAADEAVLTLNSCVSGNSAQ